MRLILTEKVKSLGDIGEFVNVTPGYARNYLLPQKLALLADEGNTKAIENQQRRLAKKIEEYKNEALALKSKIDSLKIEMVKKVGSNGKLFGTVTNTELAKELQKHDIDVERRVIVIEDPIKGLGNFTVKVKLFSGVEGLLKVSVIMDPKQAEEIKQKQMASEKRAAAKKSAAAENGEEVASEEVAVAEQAE